MKFSALIRTPTLSSITPCDSLMRDDYFWLNVKMLKRTTQEIDRASKQFGEKKNNDDIP